MKLIVNGKQLTVRESMKTMAEEKLSKFDRFFGDEAEATVTFSVKHGEENLEITIRCRDALFRSEVCADTFATAMDRALDALVRQIHRNKTRLERKLRDDTLQFAALPEEDDVQEEPDFRIRRKSFPIKPMSPEEAILQMNLLGHDFFVFTDDESGKPSVVYRRKDGDYGLIVPSGN